MPVPRRIFEATTRPFFFFGGGSSGQAGVRPAAPPLLPPPPPSPLIYSSTLSPYGRLSHVQQQQVCCRPMTLDGWSRGRQVGCATRRREERSRSALVLYTKSLGPCSIKMKPFSLIFRDERRVSLRPAARRPAGLLVSRRTKPSSKCVGKQGQEGAAELRGHALSSFPPFHASTPPRTAAAFSHLYHFSYLQATRDQPFTRR